MKRSDLFCVVYEDTDLLVVNKPAGLVCHPTKTDEYSSLISRARLYLGPGTAPQLVNRLDRETSGITLIAITPESARELRRLWEQRKVEKDYAAIVRGTVASDHGVIDASLGKDATSQVAIKDCVCRDGQPAITEYWVDRRFTRPGTNLTGAAGEEMVQHPFTLLRARPHTGRKHQIRIHLAHLGHPIVGDKIYGGEEDLYLALVENRLTGAQRARLMLPHQALHARSVRFHWRGKDHRFEAEPEGWFTDWVEGQPATGAVD